MEQAVRSGATLYQGPKENLSGSWSMWLIGLTCRQGAVETMYEGRRAG